MRNLFLIVPLIALSACGASDIPLVGPCAASKRIAPDAAYRDLALTRVVRALSTADDYPLRSEEDRASRLARIEAYRAAETPRISDGCLRAHTNDWIDFYANKVRGMTIATVEPGGYEEKQAEKADQRRALAEKLGVIP